MPSFPGRSGEKSWGCGLQHLGTQETPFHGADTGLGAGDKGGAVCHSPKKSWTRWVVLSTILMKGWTPARTS